MMFSDTPMVVQVPLPVGRVDQDTGDGTGALTRVEDPYPVVGQVDVVERGELGPDGGPQGAVERVDRAVAFGDGDDALLPHVHLHRGLGHDTEHPVDVR